MDLAQSISIIMTKNVKTIHVEESLYDAKSTMLKHQIRHLPVVNGKKLIGILSLTDIMRLSFGQVFVGEEQTDQAMMDLMTIEHVMREHPKTINVSNSIAEVADIFIKEEFHALPVVDGENLAGIITTTDMIKFFVTNY